MLTLEETGWSLNCFKIFSSLNILPIEVDVKSGRIQRQSNRVKVFIWKCFYGVGACHWLYLFGRLVQSTILEPEKYFRWDHFVLHYDVTFFYAVFYFTGFRLFVKIPEKNVMIFNKFFTEREDLVQKMIDESQKLGIGIEMPLKSGIRNGKQGDQTVSTSVEAEESSGQGGKTNEVTENGSESESPRRPLWTWPLQYSLEELLAKLLPIVLVFTVFLTILIFAIDPSQPLLLYSSLPPEYQNVWSFLILLAVEALCLTIVFFTCGFSIFTQLLFFGKCQLEFQRMSLQLRNLEEKFQRRSLESGKAARNSEREIWILRQILEEMRELVLLIELFNRCFPLCIFAFKIFALSECIILYFFAIRHYENFPILAVFVGYCATLTSVVYSILYEHAFSIPGKMDDLKNEFLLTAQKTTSNSNADSNGNKNLWAEMKSEIKRIHGVGIKVGGFNQMERESTPKFVDFVFNQVVSLLVTFP